MVDIYKRFRYEFALLNEFIVWYNNRPHESLGFSIRDHSALFAFLKNIPHESILAIGITFIVDDLMKRSNYLS